ncbi:MAG: hypothetical protein PVH37_09910 [Desulfobacterales bacterium]|jgi:hypothetical protein
MDLNKKCKHLADEIRKILGNGITLGSEVIHYIDSTFSNPTTTELQTILLDDSNCEKDSLMELLLFPDETMQLQLESLLERSHFQQTDEKSVLGDLLQDPVQATIRFPENRGSLRLRVTVDLACQFIARLHISKHLNPSLLEALNQHQDETTSDQIKVKLRNSRFLPTAEKVEFLCLFFKKFDSQVTDFFECLDVALSILDEPTIDRDIYRTLMTRKKFYFRSLQKAKQLDTQLQKQNVETLMAQGKKVLLIDQRDARKKMRIIDRISRAVFGKTEYFNVNLLDRQDYPDNIANV